MEDEILLQEQAGVVMWEAALLIVSIINAVAKFLKSSSEIGSFMKYFHKTIADATKTITQATSLKPKESALNKENGSVSAFSPPSILPAIIAGFTLAIAPLVSKEATSIIVVSCTLAGVVIVFTFTAYMYSTIMKSIFALMEMVIKQSIPFDLKKEDRSEQQLQASESRNETGV